MGEVYRARDTRLDRSVALKVLAPELAADAAAHTRFEREARAIAALSHPHICTLHDVGEYAGLAYLVMELLDGETLAARLERGPLPLDQAIRIAGEIAGALDLAHRSGIVHRDLKPANVMLTKAGAKLLDFGLAKLRPAAAPVTLSGAHGGRATTIDTAQGTVLGTVQYMAPEQVEGREADARSDIWALGAVLYEMVTGARAFPGDTPASVIGAILKDTPEPLTRRQPLSPLMLDQLVSACLVKDRDERWQSAADLRRQLATVTVGAAPRASVAPPRRAWLPWALCVAFAAAAAVLGVRGGRLPTPPQPRQAVTRFQLTVPPGLTLVPEQPPAVSPDGQRLALVAVDLESGRREIYLRPLNSTAVQVVRGTSGAQYPFWSPDGTKLAFFGGTRLRVVDLSSGALTDVASAPNPGGPGQWVGPNILFPRSTGPVVAVPAAGGAVRSVTTFDALRETNQSLAGVLADGRVLATSQAGLFSMAPDGTATRLSETITMPATLLTVPSPDGPLRHVVAYLSNGRLMAQRLAPDGTAVLGDAVEIAGEASRLVTQSARPFSAGANVLAFTSRSGVQTRPTWVGRTGEILGPAASVSGQLRDIRLSPDARSLSLARFSDQGRFELLAVDLRRDTVSRLAPQLSFQQPNWAPDGLSILGVGQEHTGARGIYRVPLTEGAAAELILTPAGATPANPQLSPDGTLLSYVHTDADGNFDIYVRPLAERGSGRALVGTEFYDAGARLSPDGRWVAYHSNEDGVLNIYVRSFPEGRDKLQISLDGGQRPSWRRDGRELFYLAPDGGLMAVAVGTGDTLTVNGRARLFTAPVDPSFGTPGATLFDPAPDGQRFVMLVPTSSVPQPITVVLNWQTLLTPE